MLERSIDGRALLELVEEVVGRGGLIEIRVHGSSMYPTLADGDLVVLGSRRRGTGSLALTLVDGHPMLHRLVRITGPWALLRAEACRREDWVRVADLRAEVYAVRRREPRWMPRLKRWLRAQ